VRSSRYQAQRWTDRPSTNPHFRGTRSFAREKPGGKHECRNQVSKRHRNPHERSSQGLVFERRQAKHSVIVVPSQIWPVHNVATKHEECRERIAGQCR
jgi:hypothetical protein